MKRALIIACSTFFVVASCQPPYHGPWAEAQAPTPTAEIKQAVGQVLGALKEGAPSDALLLARIRKILEPQVDFEEMGRRVLGRHYAANQSRMPEFIGLFQQLLERTYIQRVWLEEGRSVTVSYQGERLEDGSTAMVRIKITAAKGAEVQVEFRLHRKSERWLIYDILIESMSLVSNYRTLFNRILLSKSFDELLLQMQKTIAQAKEVERQDRRR